MLLKAFKLAIKETLTGTGKIHLLTIALFVIPFTIFVANNNLTMSIIWFVGAFISIPLYVNLICNYEKLNKKQDIEQSISVMFKDIPDNYTCKYLTIGNEYQGFLKKNKEFIDVIDNRGVMSNYSIDRFDTLK